MQSNLISITNWNDFEKTARCVNSVINCYPRNYDVLVFDNFSNKRQYSLLLNFLDKITKKKKLNFHSYELFDYKRLDLVRNNNFFLIKSNLNSGCTGGYNVCYDFAIFHKYKYVARVDNDCVVKKDFLIKLVSFLNKNTSFVGINSKVCYFQKKDLIQWAGCVINHNLKFHTPMRVFKKQNFLEENRPDLNSSNWQGLSHTDALNGPGSLIRVEALKKVGLASNDFFFGPEDIELSYRLSKVGKLGVFSDSVIYHEVAQSIRIDLNNNRSYQEFKSYLILIKKIGSFWDKFFGYSVAVIKLFYFLLFNFKLFKKLLRSFYDFILKRYGEYDLIINNKNVYNASAKAKYFLTMLQSKKHHKNVKN
jgi:GT2 family glycosyltransferase